MARSPTVNLSVLSLWEKCYCVICQSESVGPVMYREPDWQFELPGVMCLRGRMDWPSTHLLGCCRDREELVGGRKFANNQIGGGVGGVL